MTPRASLKDAVFLRIALELAELGTCDRALVGAVVVKDGRCVTWGYNGAPPGLPHCDENYHGWDNSEEISLLPTAEQRDIAIRYTRDNPHQLGCRNATHAEANALAFAARSGISVEGGTLFVTVSPCETCARLLIASGISRVVYHEQYRDPRGVEVLKEAGVQVG